MDYRGIYHDLAEMERRALAAAKQCDLAKNEEQAQCWDRFIWELKTFMSVVTQRRW